MEDIVCVNFHFIYCMTTNVGDNITHQPASCGHNYEITYSTPEEIFDCKQCSENILLL